MVRSVVQKFGTVRHTASNNFIMPADTVHLVFYLTKKQTL